MRAILDTCVLVAARSVRIQSGVDSAISSLSYAEMQYGVGQGPTSDERAHRLARLERVRMTFGPGLPFDDNAAVSYGLIADAVRSRGRSVRGRQVDLMIAATAHAHGAVIMTLNLDDFAGLDGLVTVISPS